MCIVKVYFRRIGAPVRRTGLMMRRMDNRCSDTMMVHALKSV
ncbi:hypothetical protein JOF48_002093 [Arthrobacter stackebrandtii]|uniref:Uncharacterized protein n=1 Tax=Arthrobacter stackebrandtii TaxID=272161 RepID=A0ABS4YX60_9MICC|nr:hypothetical protein [Arthrobacter stackebrandtii]